MPELPEVETVKRGLARLLPGKVIKSVIVDENSHKSFPNAESDIETFFYSASVISVRRRAKVLVVSLSTDYALVIHLKMTGQLVYRAGSLEMNGDGDFAAGHPNDSLVGKLPDRSTRVTIMFSDGSHLFFNDQRKFGWIKLMPEIEVETLDFFKKVGPEPLSNDFTAEEFTARFTRRARTTIKAAILDQSVVAGVGNIYADESLWAARIHPSRLVGSVTTREFTALFESVRAVMNLSIEQGGSTAQHYVQVDGKRGNYLEFANVFRREGHACRRCGTEIVKLRVAGRGTHVCLHCQPLIHREQTDSA